MGLLSILTGGVSKKYEAVQGLANELSQKDAAYCYDIAFMGLCHYLDAPFELGHSSRNKTAYVEPLVALHERLRGFDPWFSRSKGQFRMDLVRAVLRDFRGEGVFAIAKTLGEFGFNGKSPDLSFSDKARLGYHVEQMVEVGP